MFNCKSLIMKIERFEDAEVWCLARELAKEIYEITGKGEISKDFSFRDQIRRSSVSIMANIAEGFERKSTKEFLHFLYIAKGSAGEVRSHLYFAADIGFMDQESSNKLITSVSIISRSLSGFIKYLSETKES